MQDRYLERTHFLLIIEVQGYNFKIQITIKAVFIYWKEKTKFIACGNGVLNFGINLAHPLVVVDLKNPWADSLHKCQVGATLLNAIELLWFITYMGGKLDT